MITTSSTSTIATSSATVSTASQTSDLSSVTSEPSHSSRAWIAGPVVGSVAGVAILAALVICWLVYRRKRNQTSLPQEQPFMSQVNFPPQQYSNQPHELHAAGAIPHAYELSSNKHDSPVHELSSDKHDSPVHELNSDKHDSPAHELSSHNHN